MNKKIIKSICFILILCILSISLTGCSENNGNESIQEKIDSELAYLDTKLIGMLNKANGISLENYIVKAEKINENTKNAISLKERMQNTGKLLASAWVGTINKFSSLKTNVIAFGNKIKDSTIAAAKKIRDIGNTKVEFDIFKYNVSRLQNQPVSELRTMLSNELQGVTNEQ